MDMPGVGVGSGDEQEEKKNAVSAAANTVRAINVGLLGIAKLCSIGFLPANRAPGQMDIVLSSIMAVNIPAR